jgi:hypothetical protein
MAGDFAKFVHIFQVKSVNLVKIETNLPILFDLHHIGMLHLYGAKNIRVDINI